MAERRNGMAPYSRRKHGSEQRGVMPVPRSLHGLDALRQSKKDRDQMLEAARLRASFSRQEFEDTGLGNRDLPVHKHKQEIVSLVEQYKAIILGGPTGSGKSTQVPQYLMEAGYRTYMLVPRRIIADGLYDRLIEELTPHLGEEEARAAVGIAHGERSEHSDASRITIMTPNTFARMADDVRQRYGNEKVAVISDEIHEANLYTEVATGIAAQAVDELENWRLIAASATHNAASLKNVFCEINGGVAPSIDIEGRPFDLDIQESPEESPMQVYARMGQDHQRSMIFTSGKEEIEYIIESTKKALEAEEPGSSRNVVFRRLHGELTDIEMRHIDDPVAEDQRLVIVSSPAGMSGITISGVTLAITDGTINRSELDDDSVSGLTRRYLAKAEVIQQMGRAGRDVAGGIGVLAKPTAVAEDRMRARGKEVEVEQMPYKPLDERDDFGPPEIYHSILSSVVLTVADLERSFTDINSYIPNPVQLSAIIKAEESLSRIGALDDYDKIMPIGRQMSKMPIRPELSRGVVEAVRQDRSLQQKARIALIAAAIDAGGVQDFRGKRNKEWKKLLRPTTKDDFMAQLDLMLTETPQEEGPYTAFLAEYDLGYQRMKRARKSARKILHTLGIRRPNTTIMSPRPDEEQELRRDLTAGMIDFIYEKTKVVNKRQHYQNIHSDPEGTQRFISDRSLVDQKSHQYVAGFPRWYETALKTGGRQRHHIIESLMPADPDVVGEFAAENQLLGRTDIQPFYNGEQVLERYQPAFGSIAVGQCVTDALYETIPQKSQNLLVHHVLQQPGQAQKALREVVNELDYYRRRLPIGELAHYLRDDAPALLTKDMIDRLVRDAATKTRSAYVVDQAIARYIFKNNVGIERYFDEETRHTLIEQVPDEITIEGRVLRVHYNNGEPYIIGSHAEILQCIAGRELVLPGGRQVLVQITDPERGKIRVSASDL